MQLCGFYERAIQRLQGDWQGRGSAGDEFVRMAHPYQTDLNILGRGSLFELLCTTRSSAGAERLASYLVDPTDIAQARSRQAAVQELRDATDLRESLALAGKYEFQGCDPHVLREWLQSPVIEVPRSVSRSLLLCSSLCFTLTTLIVSRVLDWHQVLPFVLPPFLVQMAISAALGKRVQPVLAALSALANELSVLGDGLALMQRQSFQSEKLKHLVEIVRCPDADLPIRKLKRFVRISERRRNEVLYSFSLWFSVGTQLAIAVERWRKIHASNLERWLEAWAEFEALNALTGYAHEQREHVFPELVEGAAVFEAQALGHPLLPPHACVGKDVRLNSSTPFYLVTGSNMAGKSTWLRALGVNAVLAAAGGRSAPHTPACRCSPSVLRSLSATPSPTANRNFSQRSSAFSKPSTQRSKQGRSSSSSTKSSAVPTHRTARRSQRRSFAHCWIPVPSASFPPTISC
jgi:hypothetical protein